MGFLNDHKIQYKNNLDFKKKVIYCTSACEISALKILKRQ